MPDRRMTVVYAWVGGSSLSVILYSVFGVLTVPLWISTAYLWILSLAAYFAYPANAPWKRKLWKITIATLPLVGIVLVFSYLSALSELLLLE